MAPRRLLCARFAHLGLLVAWRRHPELRNEAVVVAMPADGAAGAGGGADIDGRSRVVAASPAARAAGVRPGQQLLQARQRCPGVVQLAVDAEAVAALAEAALAAFCSLAPAVELGDEEGWCDLSGSHAAFGGEAAWAAATARALTAALGGEAPAVGVASTRFTAWMAARQGTPGRLRLVPAGEEPGFLAPLGIGLLPVDALVRERLGALGIERLGQVAALPPAELRRQFGDAGEIAWRYARGRDDLPLTPRTTPREIVERVVLDGPVTDREVLRRCAELACTRLAARLGERGLTTSLLSLTLEEEVAAGSSPVRRRPPLPAGGGDLWPAVLSLLGGVQPTSPVAALRLEATGLAATTGRQVDLWRRGDAAADAVAVASARLGDRFGAETVLRPRLALDPGDLPERRFRWELPAAAVLRRLEVADA